ncbi:MAG TPA: AMP-binding protein [Xanthobacteraceae bacterium]|nr:AMP-binding protein [Xanthobacteraceae bacterium]
MGPLNIGALLARHARLDPDTVGARDLDRQMSFREWNRRACRLANALRGLGLSKGDRIAVLAYNCIEWLEIYAATAKTGLIAVPINFRLVAPEIRFIVENCEASGLIVQDALAGVIEEIRRDLPVPADCYIHFGRAPAPAGYRDYEALIEAARDEEPDVAVGPHDPWTLMYTSGTTGRPKGAIRSHTGSALLSFVTQVELQLTRQDSALLVMPLCHANSLFFFGAFAAGGAPCCVYSRRSFDPEHCLATLANGGTTFTSLVPTQYIMMLNLPAKVRAAHDVARVSKLMISSAPARQDTKREIMAMFPNAGLFELYGSTEAGWVTMLHPDEQFTKLGSVGRECVGSRPIRLLDERGEEVPDGTPGELYSSNPWTFDGYWKLPDKTREAFRGDYCTVGDMARRDADGYIHLVDRKTNMIVSGGENVYPSEVEGIVGTHPKVKDVAVIGVADAIWGERVHAVVIPRGGVDLTAEEVLAWCRDRIAGYKRPRSVSIISDDEMPRTATGKVLHRALRARFAAPPR